MRNRLLLVMVGVVALVLLVHDVPLANHLERVERDRLITKFERDAFILAGRAEEALEGGTAGDDAGLNAIAVRYAAEEDVDVVVTDADAIAVISSDPDKRGEDFGNRDEIVGAIAAGNPQTGERYSETLGEDLVYVAVPALSGTERVGAVRISVEEGVVSGRVNDRIRGLLFVALLSLLIASFVAWIVARSVSRPLRRLNDATDQLAAGELSTRADVTEGPPEVRDLAASVNSMAARLEQLVDRQRAFAGTASHQLRTPLTAIRLRLEQLAVDVDDPDGVAAIDSALAETDRLHRMIEGLLALSRAEDAALGPVAADLAAAVSERAEHWRPLADESGVSLETDVPTSAMVLAVPGSVEQIIDNLVDNALEVSPAGGRLRLTVTVGDDGVELHVIDDGPGMSADDRARAHERFWRGDEAAPGGTGLGLAIVHQLAAAAGGSTDLRAANSGGVDAVVSFRVP